MSIKRWMVIVVAVAFYGYLFWDDVALAARADWISTTVTGCDSRIEERAGAGHITQKTYHAFYREAKVKGTNVRGMPGISDRGMCESAVGREIVVLYDAEKPEQSRLLTFFDFILFPYIGFYLLALTILVTIQVQTKMVKSVNAIMLVVGGILLWLDL